MKGAFIYNMLLKKLHVWDTCPSTSQTSHQKILDRLGYNIEDCIGGSVKDNGEISFRSRSVNFANFGYADLVGSPISCEIRKVLASNTPIYNMNYYIESMSAKYNLQYLIY